MVVRLVSHVWVGGSSDRFKRSNKMLNGDIVALRTASK